MLLGVLWLAVGAVAAATLYGFDPAGEPLATGVAGVGYCLIGLSYLLERPRSWWVETE